MIEPGIDLSSGGNIKCSFGKTDRPGHILNSTTLMCISPFLQETSGFIDFMLCVNGSLTYESQFLPSKIINRIVQNCILLLAVNKIQA